MTDTTQARTANPAAESFAALFEASTTQSDQINEGDIVSVIGQVIVGFGVALLLNRDIPFKGLITTLLLLPMMLSMAVVGLFGFVAWSLSD